MNWVIQQRGPPLPAPRAHTHTKPQAGKRLWSHIAPSCWKAWGLLASTPQPFLLKLHNRGFHHSAAERTQDQGSHRPGVFVASVYGYLYDLGQVSSPLGASELASGGTSLVVQWLRLHHFTAGCAGSNPDQGN